MSEKSPVWHGCEYFRMSAKNYKLIKDYYAKNGLGSSLIQTAIDIVEDWLADGESPKAVKARDTEDHHRRLRAPWVLQQVSMQVAAKNRLNTISSEGGSSRASAKIFRRQPAEPAKVGEIIQNLKVLK